MTLRKKAIAIVLSYEGKCFHGDAAGDLVDEILKTIGGEMPKGESLTRYHIEPSLQEQVERMTFDEDLHTPVDQRKFQILVLKLLLEIKQKCELIHAGHSVSYPRVEKQ